MKEEFEIIQWDESKKYYDNALIFKDIYKLKGYLDLARAGGRSIIAVSGGFDVFHYAHLRYIQSAKALLEDSFLVVIVNKDSWLERKKGYVFMKEDERLEIISGIRGVDAVVSWDDGSPSVAGALEILQPDIFANGGDRNSIENVPEYEICKKIKCKMAFGVGGKKIQSSSELIKRYENRTKDI